MAIPDQLFGERLRAVREAGGVTQSVLADWLNTQQATISSWEHGRSYPSLPKFLLLTEIFPSAQEVLMGRGSLNLASMRVVPPFTATECQPDEVRVPMERAPITAASIKTLRRALKISQAEAARAAQITRSTYTALERGARCPRMGEIRRLAKLLGTTTADLLSGNVGIPNAEDPEAACAIAQDVPKLRIPPALVPIALERIREARILAGLSQQDVADRLGSARTGFWMSKFERGLMVVRYAHIAELAPVLGVPESYLLGETGLPAESIRG